MDFQLNELNKQVMKENKNEIHLGLGSHLNIQTSKLVSINDSLILVTVNGTEGPIELNVKIEADFNTIPEKHHEVFLNIMTARYYGKVSLEDNLFSRCLPAPKKRWFQFWKR
jgi:hypothetical protein